jgi:hypothetical protein
MRFRPLCCGPQPQVGRPTPELEESRGESNFVSSTRGALFIPGSFEGLRLDGELSRWTQAEFSIRRAHRNNAVRELRVVSPAEGFPISDTCWTFPPTSSDGAPTRRFWRRRRRHFRAAGSLWTWTASPSDFRSWASGRRRDEISLRSDGEPVEGSQCLQSRLDVFEVDLHLEERNLVFQSGSLDVDEGPALRCCRLTRRFRWFARSRYWW